MSVKSLLTHYVERLWYDRKFPLKFVFLPFSWLFMAIVFIRRQAYRIGLLRVIELSRPVIIVGNLSVGGTGKTPMVIWLASVLKANGYHPGIISRGYSGKAKSWPQMVSAESDPVLVGDEPIVLARNSGCPIAVGPDRVAAANLLIDQHDCDVVISDDGLQHYRLGRILEIAVIDGVRRFGNGCCLPAGPLREPLSRLQKVDFQVSNGMAHRGEHAMRLEGETAVSLRHLDKSKALSRFFGEKIHAVAGVGNPRRFFDYLKRYRLSLEEHPFPDHHHFSEKDLAFGDEKAVLMTEKDAVKCQGFAGSNCWYVPIKARFDDEFSDALLARLKEKMNE